MLLGRVIKAELYSNQRSPMRALLCIFLGLIPWLLVAQSSSSLGILVIPYNPDFYFSDADHQLAENNQVSIPEIRDRFRSGLQLSMQTRIYRHVGLTSKSLLVTKDDLDDQDQLAKVYRSVSYRMADTKVPLLQEEDPEQGQETVTDKVKKWLNLPDKKVAQEDGRDLGLNFTQPEKGYMHAHLRNPDLLRELYQTYGTTYFLFINQFELITNFAHCLDRSVDNFERSVRVHFTLYDYTGKWLYGNAVTMTTDTRAMKTQDIIDENCIPIANFIAEQLPQTDGEAVAP